VNAQSAWQLLAYVILPYVALAIFVLGHIWRYRFDELGWTSQSSQLYERRLLLLGSPLFHYGAIAAIGGHALGLLIPESWTRAIGISEATYVIISKVAGTSAVVLCVAGLVVLTVRRAASDRVRLATDRMDVAALGLLWVMVLLGTGETVIYNLFGPGYNYRPTVSVWLRGIFAFHPNVASIAHTPAVYQVHAILAWFFLALFPFTRFVHFWSVPVGYLTRPFVVYQRRRTAAILSPGESAGWQTSGRSGRRG
jgi:nitrate reductase gamma subunit